MRRVPSNRGESEAPDTLGASRRWVESLSRHLELDPTRSEDLTQDVLVELLERGGPDDPSRARAWVRTVARRIRDHGVRRAHMARHAERRAARPESIEAGQAPVEDELLAALRGALSALSSEDRELLVRRFLDERSPQEIARELGVSSPTARKRISRALGRLRLHWREHAAAIAPLALLPRGELSRGTTSAAVPATASSAALPWIMFKTSRFALVVLAVSAIAFVGWRTMTARAVPPEAESGVGATALAEPEDERVAAVDAEDDARVAAAESPAPVNDVAVAAPSSRKLFVVDEGGAPLPHAKVAIVEPGRGALALALDDDASAEIPNADRHVFVHADGYLPWSRRSGEAEPLEARLLAQPTIDGVLLVDGRPPGVENEWIWHYGSFALGGLDTTKKRLNDELRRLGVLGPTGREVVGADGRFTLRLAPDQEVLWVSLASHLLASDAEGAEVGNRRDGFRIDSTAPELRLFARARPSVNGRYVWDDDGAPVEGTVTFAQEDAEGYSIRGSTSMNLGPRGDFTVPIHVRRNGDDPLESLADAAPGELIVGERAVTVHVYADSRVYLADSERKVPIAGSDASIDLGEIRVKRPSTMRVRVVCDAPRAVVRSPRQTVETNAEGECDVIAYDGEFLDVIADGHEFVRTRVETGGDEPHEVTLRAAPTLTLRMPTSWATGTTDLQPRVRLEFEQSPFGNWFDSTAEQPEMHLRVHRSLHGRGTSGGASLVQSDSVTYYLPDDATVEVSGLRRGATFEVAFTDCAGREIDRIPVTFDGRTSLAPRDPEGRTGSLVLRVFDETGDAIDGFRLGLKHPSGSSWRSYDGDSVAIPALSLEPLEVTVELPDRRTSQARPIRLAPGENVIDVTVPEAAEGR